MNYKQHLYYALGIMAYGVARADGKVQYPERKVLTDLVENESGHEVDVDYAEIIFNILQKDEPGMENIIDWAVDSLHTGEAYLTPEIKADFIRTIEKVAEAFPPTTKEEKKVIDKFKKEIEGAGVKV